MSKKGIVQFLVIQIRLGNITLEEVPEKYRADVEILLNS